LTKAAPTPSPSGWVTIYFSAGKKEKINKIDFVGFLIQTGGLKKEDIGLISVLDHTSYVAVKRQVYKALLERIKDKKVKGQKLKIARSR
jgi:ATP-independent RNA helicase DbpA